MNNLIDAKKLQKKKQQQVKVSANEEKNIFQLIQNSKVKIQKAKEFTCFDRQRCMLTHDKREAVVIFERDSGTAYYTFQWVIGHMYR